jgi:hypothetical protein
MINWIDRAKAAFAESADIRTDKTDNRNLTAVLSVQEVGGLAVSSSVTASNVSFGSAHTGTMTAIEENRILAWLAAIGETDAAAIAYVVDGCRASVKERQGFLRLADTALPPVVRRNDERRTCRQCANLTPRGLCLAAHGGAISGGLNYRPMPGLLMRCKGYRAILRHENEPC